MTRTETHELKLVHFTLEERDKKNTSNTGQSVLHDVSVPGNVFTRGGSAWVQCHQFFRSFTVPDHELVIRPSVHSPHCSVNTDSL